MDPKPPTIAGYNQVLITTNKQYGILYKTGGGRLGEMVLYHSLMARDSLHRVAYMGISQSSNKLVVRTLNLYPCCSKYIFGINPIFN